MATTPTPYPAAPLPYAPIQAPTAAFNQGRASSTSDPRAIAANQLQQVQGQGQVYQQNDQNLANQYAAQAGGTQQYLNPIENTLATGGGGYNAAEQNQIALSPQDKQNIITGAGISAGAGTASSVGAAERAAAAAGGNPAALATYRARAAQTQGAQAGDAMTQARIAAKEAGSQGAQTVGNARMGQQAQGLGYYQGLQGQQNQTALAEQGLAQGAYGTETAGTGQASQLGVQASQTPSTFGQIMGGVAGALPGAASAAATLGLADGTSGFEKGVDAVLGEDGPEMIVEGASDPVRSHTKFMDTGGVASDDPGAAGMAAPTATPAPGWKQLLMQGMQSYRPGAAPSPAPTSSAPKWNTATPWSQMGSALGTAASAIAPKFAGQTYNVPYRPDQILPAPSSASPSPPPDGSAFAAGAPDSMMADGGAVGDDSEGSNILNDYLGVSTADSLRPPQSAGTGSQGQQPTTGQSAGSAVGTGLADAAALGLLANGAVMPYRSRPYMADGGMPDDATTAALPALKAPGFNPGKLVTGPTRVHLDPGDKVVPLSYRPVAKVRPSAALAPEAVGARMLPHLRHTYGGIRA